MINHKINGWSSAFDDDPKKRKRMRLWVIIALLIGSAAYFTFNYVKSNPTDSFSEAKENVRTEKSVKDSTSVKEQKSTRPASEKEAKREVNKTTKYFPEEEALIERPVCPKRFNSSEEVEEFHKLLNKYNEQQKKINEWKHRGNTVYIRYKDHRIEDYLNSLEEDNGIITI
jgi:hypothetical protein